MSRLGNAAWPDVAAGTGRILLIPVGSCEQHGPHLPLDTDTRIAVAVCRVVAERFADHDPVWVAPPVTFGASGEHEGFAGTLSVGTDVLSAVLVELGRSALPDPAAPAHRHVVFVNGHGGNATAVRRAVDLLVAEGRPVSAWSPRVSGGDAHAGVTETSLLLAIAPDVVGEGRPVGVTTPVAELAPRLRAGGVRAVSDTGVLGDASGASAEAGVRLLAGLAGDLVAHLDDVAGRPPDDRPTWRPDTNERS